MEMRKEQKIIYKFLYTWGVLLPCSIIRVESVSSQDLIKSHEYFLQANQRILQTKPRV